MRLGADSNRPGSSVRYPAPWRTNQGEQIIRPARLQARHAFGGEVAEQQADAEQ
jgi:hypothetical protein